MTRQCSCIIYVYLNIYELNIQKNIIYKFIFILLLISISSTCTILTRGITQAMLVLIVRQAIYYANLSSHSMHLMSQPQPWARDQGKGLQGCGPKRKLGVTQHTPGSVRGCEGMNPHTPMGFHCGNWSPSGFLNFQKTITGVKP